MYLRAIHADSHIPTLRNFIKNNPLGTVTTAIASSGYPFLQTSHIPWVMDVTDASSESELGVLRGHMARQNPQAKAMIESAKCAMPDGAQGGVQLDNEVLVLFTAHAHHYVTPKFYTETKPATGKVVPTWNYSAVQAYGKATIFFDNGVASTEYLSRQIHDLSQHAETSVMGYDGVEKQGPWKVSDAPDRYIALLQKNIIGIQVDITSLGGKFKMSQEMPENDREGVIAGFESLDTALGKEMARNVSERQELMRNKT
ncbi:transcriptional regulator [Penicillium canescens]|nr:transcriptional regulator [Penicillium canescens]KAJ6075985.1 transcriptional regulator [Penicillium canescens]KAJ6158296.1 transcriptional regulator [Penicillium canescens]